MSRRPENQPLPPSLDDDTRRVMTHQFTVASNLVCAHGDAMPLAATDGSGDRVAAASDGVLEAVVADLKDAQTRAFRASQE